MPPVDAPPAADITTTSCRYLRLGLPPPLPPDTLSRSSFTSVWRSSLASRCAAVITSSSFKRRSCTPTQRVASPNLRFASLAFHHIRADSSSARERFVESCWFSNISARRSASSAVTCERSSAASVTCTRPRSIWRRRSRTRPSSRPHSSRALSKCVTSTWFSASSARCFSFAEVRSDSSATTRCSSWTHFTRWALTSSNSLTWSWPMRECSFSRASLRSFVDSTSSIERAARDCISIKSLSSSVRSLRRCFVVSSSDVRCSTVARNSGSSLSFVASSRATDVRSFNVATSTRTSCSSPKTLFFSASSASSLAARSCRRALVAWISLLRSSSCAWTRSSFAWSS
eukprot:PhM_4_TR3466/c0_g1_i1/m.60148